MKRSNIVNVIPLTRLKNDLDYFSYRVNVKDVDIIELGQLVSINFRNTHINAIVFEFVDSGTNFPYSLKEIIDINEPKPLLMIWQLYLIRFISEEYLVSMAVVAKMMVPQIPKTSRTSVDTFFNDITFLESHKEEVFPKLLDKVNLIKYRSLKTKIAFIRDQIKRLKKGEQIVIIVPEVANIKEIVSYLADEIERVVMYLNKLPKNRYWNNWLKVASGEASVIIGTRSAVFAPFHNLKTIIIDSEEDENHKQEEPNPRYHVKKIAHQLSNHFGSQIIYLTAAPSLSALHLVAQKECTYLELDTDKLLPDIKIIDQNKEVLSKNYSIISNYLHDRIDEVLGCKKKIFLFLNRRGYFKTLICKDCEYEIKPHTMNPSDSVRGVTVCPSCKGTDLRPSGLGVHHIEDLIKKEYPDINIFSIDSGDDYDDSTIQEYIDRADIVIGTEFAFRYLHFSQLGLLGVLSADILLYLNDYSFVEETFRNYYWLISMLNKHSGIVIQTRNIDLPLFTALLNYDLKFFYLDEIVQRKNFVYPPYTRLIKILYRDEDKKNGQKKINDIFNLIKSKLPDEITIHEPIFPHQNYIRKQFIWSILLKVPNDFSIEKLDYLRKLPIIIDVDPNTVL